MEQSPIRSCKWLSLATFKIDRVCLVESGLSFPTGQLCSSRTVRYTLALTDAKSCQKISGLTNVVSVVPDRVEFADIELV